MTVRQLESGRATVENQYSRILDREGNRARSSLSPRSFEVCDRKWRGIGAIPMKRLPSARRVLAP